MCQQMYLSVVARRFGAFGGGGTHAVYLFRCEGELRCEAAINERMLVYM